MVPRRVAPRKIVPQACAIPWRLSLLRSLYSRSRHSPLLRKSKFKVGKRKQIKEGQHHCLVKMDELSDIEQEDIRQVEKESLDLNKENKMDVEEVINEDPDVPLVTSNVNKESSQQEVIAEVVEEERQVKETSAPKEDNIKTQETVYDITKNPVVLSQTSNQPGIIFIFEKASLVPASVGKSYQILTSDDHANFLRRKKMDPYNYRPDIIHNALLEIMDSTIYKAGRVQGIYVRTEKGVLIKIQPKTRIPRTFRSFCSMMLELLQKLSIKATGSREKLLRLIENPVTQHLPVNSFKIGFSHSAEKVVHLKDYVGALKDDMNLVFVVGAMAHGKIDNQYADDLISVSEYPLSAPVCIRRICRAVEHKWKIT